MLHRTSRWLLAVVAIVAGAGLVLHLGAAEYLSGKVWPEPKVIDPGDAAGGPPSDAIVLFDGKDLSQVGGRREVDRSRTATPSATGGDITTKQAFGDCQLHVEWASAGEGRGTGQGRGNSGVYLMGTVRDPDPRFVRQQDLLRRPVRRRSTSSGRRW